MMNDNSHNIENSERLRSREEMKNTQRRTATVNKPEDASGSSEVRLSKESKNSHSDRENQGYENDNADIVPDSSKRLESFDISTNTIKILKENGISELFPIQAKTYEEIFKGGDLIGRDRTGTGKTLAYALPLIERMRNNLLFEFKRGQTPLILVLAPTRELALQVSLEFKALKHDDRRDFRICSVYGGTDMTTQINALKSGIEVVVGTPGRVLDLLNRGALKLNSLQAVVLDEVDQMLNFGFQEDMDKLFQEYIYVQSNKAAIQTILFSATVPNWVKEVSKKYLKPDYKFVDLIQDKEIKTPVGLKHLAIYCPEGDVVASLANIISTYAGDNGRAIIFCERKADANTILSSSNLGEQCMILHGDISQNQRERTLKSFRDGEFSCLIATDVAARGLDIPQVDLIIQLEPPRDIESYIHRSGRTARAGRSGISITLYNEGNREMLLKIENEARIKISRVALPQSHDLIKAKAQDMVEEFEEVSSEVVPFFESFAKELTEKYGQQEALCRALSIISGNTQLTQERSLLSSREGYVAYVLAASEEITRSEATNYLKDILSSKFIKAIENIKLLPEGTGVVFDIPKSVEHEILEYLEKNPEPEKFVLKKASELPLFKGDDVFSPRRRSNYGSQRGNNWRGERVSEARESGAYGRDRRQYNKGSGDTAYNRQKQYSGGNGYASYDRQSERPFAGNRNYEQDRESRPPRRFTDLFSGTSSAYFNEENSKGAIKDLKLKNSSKFFIRSDGSLALDYSYQPMNFSVFSSILATEMKKNWLPRNFLAFMSKVKKFL